MSIKTKNKVAAVCIAFVIILSGLYMFTMWLGGYNWLGWVLAIFNIVAGPACLIAYLGEVKKGVFRDSDEELEENEVIDTTIEAKDTAKVKNK